MLGLGFQISENGRSLCTISFGTALHRILHVQCCIQLCQTLTFHSKLGFLWERFTQFHLCRFLLIVEVGQLFFGIFQLLRNASKGVIQSGEISPGIGSEGYTVAHRAFQNDVELVSETVERQLHLEPTVGAKRDRVGAFHFLAGGKDDFTGIGFFCVVLAQDFHATEPFVDLRIGFDGLNVRFIAVDISGLLLNLSREVFQELILQSILLALVVSFQHFQSCHINVQIHLFLNQRITGTQSFDLRIRQSLFIHIVAGANRRFRGHNLTNELLLVLQSLIEVGIKGSLRHILEYLNFLVLVALTDDTTVSLGHIRWSPAYIQVVNSDQFILDIGASTHLLCTAKQHTHLTGTNLCKEFFFLRFGIRIMDESHFFSRNTSRKELGFNVIIDIECAIILRGRQVTKYKLSQLVSLTVLPDFQHIVYASIELAVGVIGQQRVHQSLIQPQLSAITGNLQHIVHGRVNGTAMNSRSSLGQLCHHSFLMFRGLYHHSLELCFRNRQIQLVGSLDVRNFLEHIHKLWQVEELCKSSSGSVAGSFRCKFNGSRSLTKSRSPTIEVGQVLLLESAILEVSHDRVKLGHRVADRSTGGKDNTTPTGQLVHIAALHKHIR